MDLKTLTCIHAPSGDEKRLRRVILEPLLNPVWVLIFDGERPGVFALLGGVIVIAAVTAWCVWDGRTQEPQPCPEA